MGICITEAKYSEETQKISVHNHDCYQVIFLKKGSLDATIAEKFYHIDSPAFIFISFMEPHALIPKGNIYFRYYFNISMSSVNDSDEEWPLFSILSRRPDNFCHILHLESEDSERKAEEIMKSINEEQINGLPYAENEKELLVKQLLIFLYRLNPRFFPEMSVKHDNVVWRVQRFLENNHQLQINNQELAAQFCLSKSYLSHIFKEATGYSIHQYLVNCRLSSSKTLLRDTGLSVTEIAFAVGFEDSSNFTRMFHDKYGISPREYRKSYSEDMS